MHQDYSNGYSPLRERLMSETMGEYRTFLQSLTADYKKVWRDIALGYFILIICLYVISLSTSLIWILLTIPFGALVIGYWVAYLQLFLHEGAHYNLAANRKINDAICDYLICWMVGTSIKDYRVKHFQHHRKLGQHYDTEASYFNALTPRFIFSMLLWIYALQVILSRSKIKPEADSNHAESAGNIPLLRGIAIHAVLIITLLACGAWPSALAWIGGMGIVFPFFGALRQILEHRSEKSNPAIDYKAVNHGALTRIFGNDLFSKTFGGAGFNKHLLHHWEPSLSYTRLGDFEDYLMKTSASSIISAQKSNYLKTFLEIYKHDNAN